MRYFVIIIIALMPAFAPAAISVKRATPTIQHKTFDPDKPPKDMPRLNEHEAAVTVCGFGFSAEPHYEIVSRERGADGNYSAVIAVSGVSVYVRMSIVIWTPKGVTDKLKAHEEGHRKLDELMYKKLAENAARAAGEEMDGHRFTGEGPTAAKAATNALQNMFQQAGRNYMAQTAALNEEVNNTYDALTQHGANEVTEADAMKQALEKYDHDHPAPAPPAKK